MCCLINLPLKSIIHGILWWHEKAALKSSSLFLLILQYENTDATRLPTCLRCTAFCLKSSFSKCQICVLEIVQSMLSTGVREKRNIICFSCSRRAILQSECYLYYIIIEKDNLIYCRRPAKPIPWSLCSEPNLVSTVDSEQLWVADYKVSAAVTLETCIQCWY